tara:strand:+ start:2434 stop:2655 length:222 start_codon:yes stop_codon:yes gene_type:complete
LILHNQNEKIITFIVLIGFFLVPNLSNADCTLTTAEGTDGRCFLSGGEYKCKAREEDKHCFVPTGEIEEEAGQ